MSMTTTLTPEAAKAVWSQLLPQIEASRLLTRKLIQDFPAEYLETRPVPHLGTFADMLWYLASVPHVFLDGVCEGRFAELPAMPEARSTASFLAWDDQRFGATLEKLKRLSGEDVLKPVTFAGLTQSALEFFAGYLGNVSHHVGQVTAYLTVTMPEYVAPEPGSASANNAELTDDQLASVAGGVNVTATYHSANATQLGWIAPPQTFATLGGLLGGGTATQASMALGALPGMVINTVFMVLRFMLI